MPEQTAPAIIFNLKAHRYYPPGTTFPADSRDAKRLKESLFFRCKDSQYNIIGYLTRKGAIEDKETKTIKVMERMVEMTSSSAKDILDYAKNRPGSTGLWNREEDIDEQQLKEIRQNLRATQSTVWSAVVSFTPEYGEKFCSNRAEAQKLIGSTIDKFFKDAGLDPINMKWYGAYHLNSENPHIHLLFWEAVPTHYNQRSKDLKYTHWKIKPDALLDYKLTIAKHFNTNKLDYFSLRDDIRNALKVSLKADGWIARLHALQNNLAGDHKNQYARLAYTDRKVLDRFVNDFINEDPSSRSMFDSYIASLYETQRQLRSMFLKSEEKQVPARVEEFARSRIEELFSRLGNEILNTLKYLPQPQQASNEDPTPPIDLDMDSPITDFVFMKGLEDADYQILSEIKYKSVDDKFMRIYNGKWMTAHTRLNTLYKSKDAAALAIANRLIFYTQDKTQFLRILAAAPIFAADELDQRYLDQYNWLGVIEPKNAKLGETIYQIAINTYQQTIRLPDYDNAINRAALTAADHDLINRICSTAKGKRFSQLMSSIWKTSKTDITGEFKGLDITILSMLTKLNYYTDDQAQIERIFKSSSLYRPSIFDAPYKKQFEWIKGCKQFPEARDATTYGQMAKAIALHNCMEIIGLPAYDNTPDKANLTKKDGRILGLIALTKDEKVFNSLYESNWLHKRNDASRKFTGYYFQVYRLCRIIARQTKDHDTIERIFKTSGLYRPEIWNEPYSSQLKNIKGIDQINTEGRTFKDVVINLAQTTALRPQKYWGQWNKSIRVSSISFKRFVRSFLGVVSSMNNDRQAALSQCADEIMRLNALRRARGEEIYEQTKEHATE